MIVAQDAGFGSWDALMTAQAAGTPPPGAPYVIDAKGEPHRPQPSHDRGGVG